MNLSESLFTFLPSDHILIKEEIYRSTEKCWLVEKFSFLFQKKANNVFFTQLLSMGFNHKLIFAINQHYPEINGEYYRNNKLLALIQYIFGNSNLFFVEKDIFRTKGCLPYSFPGSITENIDYYLLNDKRVILGGCYLWESQGGDDYFYHDRLIMEILTNIEIVKKIITHISNEIPSDHIKIINPEDCI